MAIFWLVGSMFLIGACATANQTPQPREATFHRAGAADVNIRRIAIMNFEFKPQRYTHSEIEVILQSSERSIENGGEILTDTFASELMRTGKYEIVERSALEKIVGELRLSASGLTNEEMNQLGQLLQIDALVLGKVNYFSERKTAAGLSRTIKVSLTVRLVNIKTGAVVWMASDEIELKGTPVQAAQMLCSRMTGKIASSR